MGKNKAPVRSDAELNAIIEENKKKARTGSIIIAIGAAALLLLCLVSITVGVIVGCIIMGIGLSKRWSAEKEIKNCMTDAAIVPALNAVFDNVKYEPEEHIADEFIRRVDMGFDFRIDEIQGSDHIRAEYKGVNIELSDISLITVTEHRDPEGDLEQDRDTNFQGMWLICDFHKRFTADVLLRERDGFLDRFDRSTVETENEAFNRKFVIYSDNPHDVFYILTPHMMEYIQAMDAKADGQTFMHFMRSGKVVLALNTGRDAFEIGKLKNASAETLREQFISEVRYVTELIDELKLVPTLHEKTNG